MPKLLHQQTGLKIVQNEKNGFVICSLHFSADARKRGEQWIRESQQGISKAKWEQEYQISYDAQMGEKVFPEIKTRFDEIVFGEGPFLDNEWPRDLPMFGGFDYGARNPSSFHIYTIVDGVIWAIWELYKPCKNIISFSKEMKECPYWDQLRWIASDPDLFNLKSRDMSSGDRTSVANQFQTLGISKLYMANNNEQAWLSQMQKHWQGPEITFRILSNCQKMIEEFEAATFVSMSERQLETQDYKEALVDRHNHSLDDCKYFMNNNPSLKQRKIKLPSMIESYSPWTNGRFKVDNPRSNEIQWR